MNSPYSEIQIRRLDDMRLAGSRVISQNPEEQVIAHVNEWLANNGLDKQDGMRNFGYDVAVSKEQAEQGLRGYEYWVTVPDTAVASGDVRIESFEADEYAVLRITDPFSNPFELIPKAWKTLNDWVMGGEYRTTMFVRRHWLEEVKEVEGITYMDIYYPVKDGGRKPMAQLAGFNVTALEKCKVIGKEIHCRMGHPEGNPIPAFWGQCHTDGTVEILDKHPGRIHENAMLGWMGDFDMNAGTFTYVVGGLFKADAVVPAGLVSVDMPESRYAVGTITGMEPDLFMCAHDFTENALKAAGAEIDYENYAEIEWYDERYCVEGDEKTIDLYMRVK